MTRSTATTTSRPRRRRSRRRAAGGGAKSEQITTFNSALRHLSGLDNVERMRARRLSPELFSLDRMRALMKGLGDPQDALQVVHVAGTKGKGSTCAMVDAAMRACGYTVGLYTSPHLMNVRERMTIDGQMIGQQAFADVMAGVAAAAKRLPARHGEATYFETLTAMALVWFAEKAVDVAVLETGLGGRLDATNIVKQPLVTAITAISLDHTQILGETIERIAAEKAGILKKGVPAVTIEQSPEAQASLERVAEQTGTSVQVLGRDIEFSKRFEASPKLGPHTCVCLTTERSAFEHVSVPLKGEHQALNCGLALAILDRLRERGFDLPETTVIESLEGLTIPGRMEFVWQSPRVLIDGAHNRASVKALIRSIGAHVPYDSMVVIFGCGEDKDVDGLLHEISLGADKVVFTRARNNARAMEPAELQRRFAEKSGKMTQTAKSLPEALRTAAHAVGREDLICVTGSFHLAGEAKKRLQRLAREGRDLAVV